VRFARWPRIELLLRLLRIEQLLRLLRMEQLLWCDSIESTDIEDPIEPADNADPRDPIEANDPMLPMDRTDPSEQIERNEFRERHDSMRAAYRRGGPFSRRTRRGGTRDGATVSCMADADAWLSSTRSSYDTDAPGYAEKVRGLLDGRPYLRTSLTLFAELVHDAGGGPVADIGCGPGYVADFLNDAGVDAFGIDLSPEMVAIARRDHPDLRFEVGTMTDLDLADGSVAGIVAFWSVIHVPDHAVPGVFAQFRRVLRPQGVLLVGFHVGDETRHTSEGYTGRPVDVDSHRRPPSRVSGWLRDAGFTIEAELLLRPDEDVPGALVFARRADA
jgi:SAM-dependent methyltransferase